MGFRLGSFVLTPSTLTAVFALAFFFVLSYRRLYPRVVEKPAHALWVLGTAAIAGLTGAVIHAVLASPGETDPLHAALNLQFGSFGGYWAVLAEAIACAAMLRRSPLQVADALIPGILAGGAIARVGCLFTGCCSGIDLACAGFHPFRPWPVYDLTALLLTLGVVIWVERAKTSDESPGTAVCLFLILYGILRFFLEFLRESMPVLGPFTSGQVLAILQVAAGWTLRLGLRRRRSAMRGPRNP